MESYLSKESNDKWEVIGTTFGILVVIVIIVWAVMGDSFNQPSAGYYAGDRSKGIKYVGIRGIGMFYNPVKRQVSSEQYNWKEVAYLDGTYENHFKFGKNRCWTDKMSRRLGRDEAVKVYCDCPGRVNPKQSATMMVHDQTV